MTDNASRYFVIASVVIFAAILLYGLLAGTGGFLTAKPSPTPEPTLSAEPSASSSAGPSSSAGASGSPGASGSAVPSASCRPPRRRTQRGTDRRAVELRGTGGAERIRGPILVTRG